jgi:hypothetical protein
LKAEHAAKSVPLWSGANEWATAVVEFLSPCRPAPAGMVR